MSDKNVSPTFERTEQARVRVFDTTLRDGEQSPGISLNKHEKLEIAGQLARLGVDIIEAGFPITSPGDFEAVQAIARAELGPVQPVICGLARTSKQDIEAAWNAIKDSDRPRIHTFIATSDIHIERKLQTTREDVKGQVRAAVAHARELTDDVEFSPEDGSRSDVQYMAEVIQIALDEGATTINVPDTVGYTMPREAGHRPRCASRRWSSRHRPGPPRERPLTSLPWSAGPQGTDQGGDHLVQVADDSVVGAGQDRGARVGVDRDDVLGARAARDVLDGAADAAGQVELGGDLGAGLADLLLVRAPALGGDHAGHADHAAEQAG